MAIAGKVAEILNERDLVINQGAENGVVEGMKFKVSEPEVAITDPDTQALLGVLTREKIRVRVSEVYPRFAVAKTYETYPSRKLPGLNYGLDAFSPGGVAVNLAGGVAVSEVRKLKFGPAAAGWSFIDATGSSVSIGDPVVQLDEELNPG